MGLRRARWGLSGSGQDVYGVILGEGLKAFRTLFLDLFLTVPGGGVEGNSLYYVCVAGHLGPRLTLTFCFPQEPWEEGSDTAQRGVVTCPKPHSK